jgi:TonB family protein
MKSIFSLTIILFYTSGISWSQASKRVAQGKPYTTNVINRQMNKDAKQSDATNFNYGVNELKTKSYESAIKTFNNYLSSNPEDDGAYYNRGLAYYYLEDIDHACIDWKYAAYLDEYYAIKNYRSVCDTSFDMTAFLNSGILVQSSVYDEKFEANVIETPPSFPGGEQELNKFLKENLNISKSLRHDFLKSRILFKITIKSDGTVSNSVAMKNEKVDLTTEAIRVITKMPKWIPAVKKGYPVASEYFYPVINGRDSMRTANKLYIEGVKLFDKEDFNGALTNFSKVIAINEEDDDAHFNRGACYMKLGDTANACRDWNFPSLRCQISAVNLLNKYCGENISLDKMPTIKEAEQTIYTIVEEMPSFPNGEKAMLDFIAENVKYPDHARKKNITGRVYISFIVDKDGYVREPRILRGIGDGCDEEAIRVVQMMPQWNPGYLNGRPVNVQFNLPILFTLK